MAEINRDILIPYMRAYKNYLDNQAQSHGTQLLSNSQEDYKRDIAKRAAQVLNPDSWSDADIGKGTIGELCIKAIQRNRNLIGRFQVSSFSEKVRENYALSEQILYDLYHEHKEQECFEKLCGLFGRKYDLLAYLYFVLDPGRYLPLRSFIFDEVFKKLEIDLQTSGRCSWENYLAFLSTATSIRDVMKDYYHNEGIDLIDVHSFLWTLSGNQLNLMDDRAVKIGTVVHHKNYGKGKVTQLTDNKIYIDFDGKRRIFSYPEAIEKGYLKLEKPEQKGD